MSPAKSKVQPHPFTPSDLPPDVNGRKPCRCGLVGEAGDAHHTMPETDGQDVQRLAAGERED